MLLEICFLRDLGITGASARKGGEQRTHWLLGCDLEVQARNELEKSSKRVSHPRILDEFHHLHQVSVNQCDDVSLLCREPSEPGQEAVVLNRDRDGHVAIG